MQQQTCIDGTHAHHWRIDSPKPGTPTVAARCVRCNASRDYPTYLDYLEIEGGWKEIGKRIPNFKFKMEHLPI